MEKFIRAILIIILLIDYNILLAQNNCDVFKTENASLKASNTTLKDENRFLKEKLDFFTELNKPKQENVTPFSDKIEFKILSVKGNRVSQTVRVDFLLINQLPNQDVTMGSVVGLCKAYDNLGNELIIRDVALGNTSGSQYSVKNTLFTDTPLKGYFVFGNVLPGADLLKTIQIGVNYYPIGVYKDNNSSLSMSNLKIEW